MEYSIGGARKRAHMKMQGKEPPQNEKPHLGGDGAGRKSAHNAASSDRLASVSGPVV